MSESLTMIECELALGTLYKYKGKGLKDSPEESANKEAIVAVYERMEVIAREGAS